MRFFLSLLFTAGLISWAHAAPYLVYQGTVTDSDTTPAGAAKTSTILYLVTDLSDSSSYTLLQVDSVSHVFTIESRPSASPLPDEAGHNILGGLLVTDPTKDLAVFSFVDQSTDSGNNVSVAHFYGTGPITTKSSVLVPARTQPLTVTLKTNGVTTGTYSFNQLTPQILTNHIPMPRSLAGDFSHYVIDPDGNLTRASQKGTFKLVPDQSLINLANIGGALTVGKNTTAIQPINVPDGTPATDAYAAWLANFAQFNWPTGK